MKNLLTAIIGLLCVIVIFLAFDFFKDDSLEAQFERALSKKDDSFSPEQQKKRGEERLEAWITRHQEKYPYLAREIFEQGRISFRDSFEDVFEYINCPIDRKDKACIERLGCNPYASHACLDKEYKKAYKLKHGRNIGDPTPSFFESISI